MAMQPRDRMKAKHAMTVAPRGKPVLVRRSNKRVLIEISPLHEGFQINGSLNWAGPTPGDLDYAKCCAFQQKKGKE